MDIFDLHRGTAPLLISIPHNGTHVPDGIVARFTDSARALPDTDWHVAKLYDFAKGLGASMLVPTHSRYVVDLNRPEDDVSLYPGRNTTGLCPLVQFSGQPVYRDDRSPDDSEVHARVDRYWRPYHAALRAELDRIHAQHGRAVLWEAHSIRSVVPFLFDGRLPDLNLGTADGASCSPSLQAALIAVLHGQDEYTSIVNGRFKGGYITRHYGDPENGIDAVQLELAQVNYMDEDSFAYSPENASRLCAVVTRLLACAIR